MMNVVFVTYETRPDPSSSDALVADWLRREGHQVNGVPWKSERSLFEAADIIVVRSTWDYPRRAAEFSRWLEDMRALPIANPVGLMKWNIDKRYLLELGSNGIRIPRTLILSGSDDISRVLDEWSVDAGVVKPVVGASGMGVTKVVRGDKVPVFPHGAMMLQEFLPEIVQGELSLAYFGGAYSHAVIKTPGEGEFRINSSYGGKIARTQPPDTVIKQGYEIIRALPDQPLYARVDGLVTDQGFVLCELELVEPSFYFDKVPTAAARFGQAILAQK